MQDDFDRNFPSLDISVIGVNEVDRGAIPNITTGRDIPWLQDTDTNANGVSDVWYDQWDVVYRDVQIVDRSGIRQHVYNVTDNDLMNPANYNQLRSLMISTGVTPQESAWQNPIEPLDINANELIENLDVLLIVNRFKTYTDGILPPPPSGGPDFYIDPTGNGAVELLDALRVVNQLTVIRGLDRSDNLRAPTAPPEEAAAPTVVAPVPMEAPLAGSATAHIDSVFADLDEAEEMDDLVNLPAAYQAQASSIDGGATHEGVVNRAQLSDTVTIDLDRVY